MKYVKIMESKELILKNKVTAEDKRGNIWIQSNPVKKTFLALCFEVEN